MAFSERAIDRHGRELVARPVCVFATPGLHLKPGAAARRLIIKADPASKIFLIGQ
jgi:hypothetical protein